MISDQCHLVLINGERAFFDLLTRRDVEEKNRRILITFTRGTRGELVVKSKIESFTIKLV
jgi:hypothetical protein